MIYFSILMYFWKAKRGDLRFKTLSADPVSPCALRLLSPTAQRSCPGVGDEALEIFDSSKSADRGLLTNSTTC